MSTPLAATPIRAPATSPLPGPNTLLIGPSGTGKTWAIRTLLECGITPFCIFTEPGFEVLGDIPAEKLHWHYIRPASQSWDSMIKSAKQINMLSLESLAKSSDPNRSQYAQFVEFYECCNNFKCDRDGRSYGDVAKWNTDRALVVDGLTGLSTMAMKLQTGGKPVSSQADWQIGMGNVQNAVTKLCTDTICSFILIAHAERETDEVLGGTKIMASTLGKKLAPKLPLFFSDVILAVKEGAMFTWSTAALSADLKARNLPIKDGLPPSFVPIFESWRKRGGLIHPTLEA